MILGGFRYIVNVRFIDITGGKASLGTLSLWKTQNLIMEEEEKSHSPNS